MKLIKLTVALCFCSSVLFAETTLEILQQRAEAGDATAQTLMGMVCFYGYMVPRDSDAAQEWYQRAADQGDEFAAKRRNPQGQPTVRNVTDPRAIPQEELQKKIKQAESVPYVGKVTFDELVLKRDQYIGKVIELNFATVSVIGGSVPYIYVRDPRAAQQGQSGGASDRLYLCGEAALKWRLTVEKKYYGAASTVYALVEKDHLVALGVHKSTVDDVSIYSW